MIVSVCQIVRLSDVFLCCADECHQVVIIIAWSDIVVTACYLGTLFVVIHYCHETKDDVAKIERDYNHINAHNLLLLSLTLQYCTYFGLEWRLSNLENLFWKKDYDLRSLNATSNYYCCMIQYDTLNHHLSINHLYL